MSDKVRNEFEAAYTKEHGEDFDFCGRIEFSRENDGPYHYATVDTAWRWWKISRAALVVELPPAMHNYYGDLMNEQDGAAKELCDLLDIDEVREALTKAGVTVK